jgi:hypothetical protein
LCYLFFFFFFRLGLIQNECRLNITHICTLKTTSITYYACILALAGMQSACTVLYCHLWHVWLYYILVFPHYLTNGTIFRKKLIIM